VSKNCASARIQRSRESHSVLSPKDSLRKAGQKKRENQLFFCATVIFFEMLIGTPVVDLLLPQDSDIQNIERSRFDHCSRATRDGISPVKQGHNLLDFGTPNQFKVPLWLALLVSHHRKDCERELEVCSRVRRSHAEPVSCRTLRNRWKARGSQDAVIAEASGKSACHLVLQDSERIAVSERSVS
jgi:hypothetical protein